ESLPKPNLIVTNYPSPELCLASSSFASLNKIPLYVDVRDPWPDSFAEYFPFWKQALVYPLVAYYRGVLSRSLKLATGIVSISNYMLDWAMQYSGRNKSQNDIVFYLGSKRPVAWSMPEFISSFSKENPLRLVFVGSFGKSYNIDLLIRAFRILSEQGEDRFTLDLIGDGELVANYKELASGLQGIKFHGWCNEEKMSLILKVCHIGLIPITGGVSKYWIGNKLFEYAGFGLAIINTTPNEAYEIVSKEDMGFNLRQNDPHILAKIIKNYLDNPNILKRHRENSLKLFDSSFDAEKIYADYVKHIIAPSESK
ncbi:MAG: glycosyltransferase, partial [bacterium]|nr:glycosyltransferase [bacterium]